MTNRKEAVTIIANKDKDGEKGKRTCHKRAGVWCKPAEVFCVSLAPEFSA